MTLVTGKCFTFEVPDDWASQAVEGMTVMRASEAVGGFTPVCVLRESRVPDPGELTLASISQANLRASKHELEGGLVVRVDAVADLPPELGESRRIWMLLPASVPNREVSCVLSAQELLLVGDVVAELTVTLPLWAVPDAEWQWHVLRSLRPLPAPERGVPETVVDVPAVSLDTWASERDGRPRESLSVLGPCVPLTPERVTSLSEDAVRAWESLSLGIDASLQGELSLRTAVAQELIGAGLLDHDGRVSEMGVAAGYAMREGRALRAEVLDWAREVMRVARAWVIGARAFVLLPPVPGQHDAGDDYVFGWCGSDDVARVFLAWTGTRAGWPLSFRVPGLPVEALAEKMGRGGGFSIAVPGVPEFEEFGRYRWRQCGFEGDAGEEVVQCGWLVTQARGAVFLSPDGDDRFMLEAMDDPAPWELVTSLVAEVCWSGTRGTAAAVV